MLGIGIALIVGPLLMIGLFSTWADDFPFERYRGHLKRLVRSIPYVLVGGSFLSGWVLVIVYASLHPTPTFEEKCARDHGTVIKARDNNDLCLPQGVSVVNNAR